LDPTKNQQFPLGHPVGFLLSQYHFWAFLLNRTTKKLTGFQKKIKQGYKKPGRRVKKSTKNHKNATERQKRLQENVLSLIKGTAKILFPVLLCSFLFYRWFSLQVYPLLVFPNTKLTLG